MKIRIFAFFMILGFVGIGCQPDLQRECVSSDECPSGYRCVYSSCEALDVGEADNQGQPNNQGQPDNNDSDPSDASPPDTSADTPSDTKADAAELDAPRDVDAELDSPEDRDADLNDNADADADMEAQDDADAAEVGCAEEMMECDGVCVEVVSNAAHCGSCEPCADVENAAATCERGACVYQCRGDFVDVNRDLSSPAGDGCECERTGSEVCDGVDNDCDGLTDEGESGLCPDLENALPSCEAGECAYRCLGTAVDVNRDLQNLISDGCECVPQEREACDGMDNDCDGTVDGVRADAECPALGGTVGAVCVGGECVQTCAVGAVDLNGDLAAPGSDGCECALSGPEVCDGVDNDCDGHVDGEDADFQATPCPSQEGVCRGSSQLCAQGRDQGCGPLRYTQHASAQGTQYQAGEEKVCDEEDNDCDGLVDETCCAANADSWRTLLSGLSLEQAVNLEVTSPPLSAPDAYALAFVDDQNMSFYAQAFGPRGELRGPLHETTLSPEFMGEVQTGLYWKDEAFTVLRLYEQNGEQFLQRTLLSEDGQPLPFEEEAARVMAAPVGDYPFFLHANLYHNDEFLLLDPEPEDPSFSLYLFQNGNTHPDLARYRNARYEAIFATGLYRPFPEDIYVLGMALSLGDGAIYHYIAHYEYFGGPPLLTMIEPIEVIEIDQDILFTVFGGALVFGESGGNLEHYYMTSGDAPQAAKLVGRPLRAGGIPLNDPVELLSFQAEFAYVIQALPLEHREGQASAVLYMLGARDQLQTLYLARVRGFEALDRPAEVFPAHGARGPFAAKLLPHELGAMVVLLGEERDVPSPALGVHMAVINADGDFMCPWDAPQP